ncbi:ATP-binding protein [Novosphingobium taihuense]|uniref:Orc1-like AAA ATPase domain-containing protein n=1 Tax=Novosphingobium taihuense TaxID=260085 RepID=A0A7W7EVS8_9SPHN|nr:ATP-binding protein [Novosphingobium taihuense]MBB4615379.1 hypothetical protein [Novosphingobium taihuense]TWH82170.1 AAA ATPase-like protein [Novosphingobium taihuense]
MVDARLPRGPEGFSEALEYAALSGPFDPRAALAAISRESRQRAAEAASALAAVCDTNPDESDTWLLLAPNRQQVLRALRASGRLQDAIERRRTDSAGTITADLLDALSDTGAFTLQRVGDALGSAGREVLVRVATVLDWAGEFAAAAPLLESSRTAIKRLDLLARGQNIREQPFVGRASEIKRLMSLLAQPVRRNVRGVFMSGPPGIGKSALMEQVILRHSDEFGSVVVRLDFDRAGLDVTDLRSLTMEASRQIADRIGNAARDLFDERLRTAGLREGSESVLETRRAFPESLAATLARTLEAAHRPLLVVIDTLESLQARGETHLRQLFDWLQLLSGLGVNRMSVLVAGRAAPPAEFDRVVGDPVVLEGLSEPAALELATRLEVEPSSRHVVVDRAAGVPLAIKLAADIVRSDGIGALPRDRLNPKLASAMLYRILLSRIDDDTLRDLAHPGLIARRISADLLQDVIGPAVGLPRFGDERARELFDSLARQHWLVEADPSEPGFVRHRGDIRRDLLPLLYQDKPQLCARIDREAVKWFAARDDDASAIDALYHRLQLLRRSPTRPAIPERLARLMDAATLQELPETAQVMVKQVVGDFSSTSPNLSGQPSWSDEPRVVRDLVNIISKADWAEGRALVNRIERTSGIDPRSRLADAVRAFWWRAGQWYDANWLLRERDRMGGDDTDLRQLEPPLAVARIEMRGEYGRAAQLLKRPNELLRDTPLISGLTGISRYGGLAFRLQRVAPDMLGSFEIEEAPDPVQSAFNRWSAEGPGQWDDGAIEFVHRRLLSVGVSLQGPARPWVETQMMASLTPYAGMVVNLAQGDRLLSSRAREAVATLLAGPHSPLLLADEIAVPPHAGVDIEPITAIANAGLFAEWAEALGYVLEHPNLRSIGRAADNWRRTIAGDWKYGPAVPRGWKPQLIDEVLKARIHRHQNSPAPRELAFIQLSAWVPHLGSGEAVWDLIQRRSAGALASASRARVEGGFAAAAAKLRQYKVPTAFVPSIITLIEARY